MKLSQEDCKLIRQITDELDCDLLCHCQYKNGVCVAITSKCLLTALGLFFMLYTAHKQKTIEDAFKIAASSGYDLASSLRQIDEHTVVFENIEWFR